VAGLGLKNGVGLMGGRAFVFDTTSRMVLELNDAPIQGVFGGPFLGDSDK